MKMDIYRVINEAKDSKIIDDSEMERLFSFANDAILIRIIANDDNDDNDEQGDDSKIAEIVLKNKDDYYIAKKEKKLEDFNKKINSEIKKVIKNNRKEAKKKLFDKMNDIAKDYKTSEISSSEQNPNSIIFKLFLNEWNSKYSFTWKSFKELKKNYEKTHILEGEDLFVLKSLLEKDPNIAKKKSFDLKFAKIDKGKVAKITSGKVTDSTVFSKENNTLDKLTIDKIKEKIEKAE